MWLFSKPKKKYRAKTTDTPQTFMNTTEQSEKKRIFENRQINCIADSKSQSFCLYDSVPLQELLNFESSFSFSVSQSHQQTNKTEEGNSGQLNNTCITFFCLFVMFSTLFSFHFVMPSLFEKKNEIKSKMSTV